jgi:hypothetical protein
MKRIFTLLVVILMVTFTLKAEVIEVPTDYPTIQAALNASAEGDTIIVFPGSYVENINFRGKNVILTSLYFMESDTSYITSTIIDGSNPVYPDTASCVIFNSGEDSTAVIQGFTITGGGGTKWLDMHGAGIYREGGGILVEFSSPTIVHNMIRNNACTDLSGVTSTGGGGIRIGDGNPRLVNNSIIYNEARYGAGIVLNYTGARIVNNVIASNTGGQDYNGGSGIWITGNLTGKSKYIINNTIAYNTSILANGTGGIWNGSASNVNIVNCIIYNNSPALQIKAAGLAPNVVYSDVMGGYLGMGNINLEPLYTQESFLLDPGSPCVDAGNPLALFNDLEDPDSPGAALFPSRGTVLNDMGAYGGPLAAIMPFFETITGIIETHNTISKGLSYPNPTSGIFRIKEKGKVEVINSSGQAVFSSYIDDEVIDLSGLPEGIYFVRVMNGNAWLVDKLVLLR